MPILGPFKPQIAAKAIRLLSVRGEQRPEDMDVPALSELPGVSSFNVSSWTPPPATGKTPKAVVDHLSAEVAKVMTQTDTVQQLAGLHVSAQSSPSAQLARLLERVMARWSEVIQKANIALQ